MSLNVQDLAPSCAGALFGKLNPTLFVIVIFLIEFSVLHVFCMFSPAGVMNTCGAFSGETLVRIVASSTVLPICDLVLQIHAA